MPTDIPATIARLRERLPKGNCLVCGWKLGNDAGCRPDGCSYRPSGRGAPDHGAWRLRVSVLAADVAALLDALAAETDRAESMRVELAMYSISTNAREWMRRCKAATERAEKAERERDDARDWVRRMCSETRVLTCAFCGQAYPPDTPDSNHVMLTAHVHICPEHPMRGAEMERDAARAKLAKVASVAASAHVWAHRTAAPIPAWVAEIDAAISDPPDATTKTPAAG